MTLRKVPSIPPEARQPLMDAPGDATRPIERFLRTEALSGIVLLVAAGLALLWANSPWGQSYAQFWHAPIAVQVGRFSLERDLQGLVNEGLMVLFFFLVGLEIRRELHWGDLADARQAALPVAAALGGMLVPAFLYLVIAGAPGLRSGWGVPMVTDLAFALGLLTLLGRRVPASMRVLLLALATLDALGGSIVIALFYPPSLGFGGLFLAGTGVASICLLQRLGVRPRAAYVIPCFVTWAGISLAGIHPTMAGVVLGLLTPVEATLGPRGFVWRMQREIKMLERSGPDQLSPHQLASSLREVERTRREAISPADGLIELLHPIVAFGILPIFALANAGVSWRGLTLDAPALQLASAVGAALVLGKPLGVLIACALALRFRFAALPQDLRPRQLLLLGAVSGVGFSMALFIGQLAFTDDHWLAATKLGVLGGSAVAAVLTLSLGHWLCPAPGRLAEPTHAPPGQAAASH